MASNSRMEGTKERTGKLEDKTNKGTYSMGQQSANSPKTN